MLRDRTIDSLEVASSGRSRLALVSALGQSVDSVLGFLSVAETKPTHAASTVYVGQAAASMRVPFPASLLVHERFKGTFVRLSCIISAVRNRKVDILSTTT